MALKTILTAPDPRLKKKSKPVASVDADVRQLMDDMLETMYAAPGIGLAAPQVGGGPGDRHDLLEARLNQLDLLRRHRHLRAWTVGDAAKAVPRFYSAGAVSLSFLGSAGLPSASSRSFSFRVLSSLRRIMLRLSAEMWSTNRIPSR